MKAIHNILQRLLIIALIFLSYNMMAQGSNKDKQGIGIQKMMADKSFIFVAQSVTPQRGGFRQLTSTYDVKVSEDTVISDLPYFGVAYSAPIDPSSGGISFTSTSFDYTITARKKSGWDVVIKPKDQRDGQQFFFNIFPNGTASLQVTSNSRQPISFSGNIKKV